MGSGQSLSICNPLLDKKTKETFPDFAVQSENNELRILTQLTKNGLEFKVAISNSVGFRVLDKSSFVAAVSFPSGVVYRSSESPRPARNLVDFSISVE